jgi:hypothetical protein
VALDLRDVYARVVGARLVIHVLVKDGDEVLGEMRIECLTPFSTHGVNDYSVVFAADSGGGIVDLKRRVLYGFNTRKYNSLALVSQALNLLDLQDMEMTDEDRPGRMAWGQRGAGQALPREATNPVRDH